MKKETKRKLKSAADATVITVAALLFYYGVMWLIERAQ